MTVLDTLITDRQDIDIEQLYALRAKIMQRTATNDEWDQWNGNMRGGYNISDLNRVGEALEYLKNWLAESCGISTYNGTAKTDWQKTDVISPTQAIQYLSYVQAIKEALPGITVDTPADLINLTYVEANIIEQILAEMGKIIDRLLSSVDWAWTVGLAHNGLYAFW